MSGPDSRPSLQTRLKSAVKTASPSATQLSRRYVENSGASCGSRVSLENKGTLGSRPLSVSPAIVSLVFSDRDWIESPQLDTRIILIDSRSNNFESEGRV